MIKYFVCTWIQWRYGNVYALKPPIGYSKHFPKPIWHVMLYWIKKPIWQAEKELFRKHGQEIRDKWLKSTMGVYGKN